MPGVAVLCLVETFQSLRQHLTYTTSLVVSDRRISCIEYIDGRGARKIVQVGKRLPKKGGGIVGAIVDASLLYFICTPGHGIGGGRPIVIYATEVTRLQYFAE